MSAELLDRLPNGFNLWPALAQAAALFFSTFVLEDVAAVGAGLLLATGVLVWPTAFWSCFLGIWIGDAGLYFLARAVGRDWFEQSSWRKFSTHVEQSERWFARRENSILIVSRILPGTRLPTYLAAGFLRLPLKRFLFITGTASLLWTSIILFATQTIGSRILHWFGVYQNSGWLLLIGIALAFGLVHLVKQSADPVARKRLAIDFGRLRRWEFWPGWIFYPPVAIYCLWLAMKYRGLAVATAANPGMFSGGIVGESKMATLRELTATSPEFTAEAELVGGRTVAQRVESLREICARRQITCPFILKPDVGQRGVGIKLIRDEEQAASYFQQTDAPLIAQRYVEGPHEIGIFYYRLPDSERGSIFAITEKVFPVITGDGRSTLSELIWNDRRPRFMAKKYLKRLEGREEEVLANGETVKLVESGNHAQGCIFRDGSSLGTSDLAERIDAISQKLTGFFIGRYDVRFSSLEDLQAGKNFQIIELNGAASEATNIYDERNSLFAAYRTLFKQWNLVFAIGAANRQRGCAPTKAFALWRKWREYARQAASYPLAD